MSPSAPSSSSSPPAAQPSIWDPLKSLSLKREFQRFSRGEIPCARQSLLLGLGTGFAISAIGIISRRGIKSSLNWGVGSLIVSSFAKYQLCIRDQQMEAARMRVVIEDFKRKRSKGSSTTDSLPEADSIVIPQ